MNITEKNGIESLYIHGATASTLSRYLNPEVPWIWVLGHLPNNTVEWWETSIPINKKDAPIKAKVRSVSYDLLLETKEFLELISKFEDHGLELIQSYQKMPKTLYLDHIPENQHAQILKDNGAFLHIYLPHAIETAKIQCFKKGYLKSLHT